MTKRDIEILLYNRKGLGGYSLNKQGVIWEITLNFGPNTIMIRANNMAVMSDKITEAIQKNKGWNNV